VKIIVHRSTKYNFLLKKTTNYLSWNQVAFTYLQDLMANPVNSYKVKNEDQRVYKLIMSLGSNRAEQKIIMGEI